MGELDFTEINLLIYLYINVKVLSLVKQQIHK
jgi:hypothetical protein